MRAEISPALFSAVTPKLSSRCLSCLGIGLRELASTCQYYSHIHAQREESLSEVTTELERVQSPIGVTCTAAPLSTGAGRKKRLVIGWAF